MIGHCCREKEKRMLSVSLVERMLVNDTGLQYPLGGYKFKEKADRNWRGSQLSYCCNQIKKNLGQFHWFFFFFFPKIEIQIQSQQRGVLASPDGWMLCDSDFIYWATYPCEAEVAPGLHGGAGSKKHWGETAVWVLAISTRNVFCYSLSPWLVRGKAHAAQCKHGGALILTEAFVTLLHHDYHKL